MSTTEKVRGVKIEEKIKNRIIKDVRGRRYFMLSAKKKMKVADDISERALIKWLILHLKPRRKRKISKVEYAKKTAKPNFPGLSFHQSVVDKDALTKERNDLVSSSKPSEIKVSELQDLAKDLYKQSPLELMASKENNVGLPDDEYVDIEHKGKKAKIPKDMLEEYNSMLEKEKKEKGDAKKALEEEHMKQQLVNLTEQREALLGNIEHEAKTRYRDEVEDLPKNELHKMAAGLGAGQNPKKSHLIQVLQQAGKLKTYEQYYQEEEAKRFNDKQQLEEDIDALHVQLGEGSKNSDRGLSEIDIDKIMSKYPEYLGTVASDEIEKLKIPHQGRFGFVMNLDKRKDKGSHWVSVFGDARPSGSSSIEYYNSFAEPPTADFMKQIKQVVSKMDGSTYLKFKENKIVQQDDNSSNCGYFATKFLIDRFRGKPFAEASGYDDHIKGEKDIEKFKKSMPDFKYMSGEGLLDIAKEGYDRVKTFFTGRTDAPPAIRKLLEDHGNDEIEKLDVFRQPISKTIQKIAALISDGELEKNRERLGYDDIYHLGLNVTTGGKTFHFKLEKNQTVTTGPPVTGADVQIEPVSLDGKKIKLADFLEKGTKKDKAWQYNPVDNNCQIFVDDLLKANGLLTPSLHKFIMQDAEGLLKNSPITKSLAIRLSDFGHRLHVLFTGAGRE